LDPREKEPQHGQGDVGDECIEWAEYTWRIKKRNFVNVSRSCGHERAAVLLDPQEKSYNTDKVMSATSASNGPSVGKRKT